MWRFIGVTSAAALAAAAILLSAPSVYPTGVTTFDPGKTWSGYTVLSPLGGQDIVVIDMNGNVVKRWSGYNSSAGGPARILPGGVVIGAAGANPGRQESLELVERDFDGKELWRFDHNQEITLEGKMQWAARQHHDWQREDFPSGYYSPESKPGTGPVTTMMLTKVNHVVPKVAPGVNLADDRLIEIGPDGKITWEWTASDHIDDFKFDKDARDAIASRQAAGPGAGAAKGKGGPGAAKGGGPGAAKGGPGATGAAGFDWIHLNSATYVGPNKWFDAGDKRFDPKNVIISSREASLVAIVARDGSIVWQMGPDFLATPELRAIRQVIGQHNAHFIPKGLPGAGDLMVFDNGGASGYGRPNGNAPQGSGIFARPTSRVLEIDPTTMKLVWSYTGTGFFATNISGAQRLLNGNTLITEGPSGRIFEVTKDSEIVWEYVYPTFGAAKGGKQGSNSVYRAYRVPYEWIPQITKPTVKAVTAPKLEGFRVP